MLQKVDYTSRPIAIPDDFLAGPPEKPITLETIDFAASNLPEYKDCYAVVLENVLSPAECQQLIDLAEQSVKSKERGNDDPVAEPWQPAMVSAGPGLEALVPGYRESDRIIWDRQEIVDRLWRRCLQAEDGSVVGNHFAEVIEKSTYADYTWKFSRVNDRMRFLRYSADHFFKPHCDSPYYYQTELEEDFQTHYTVHLYLNDSAEVSPSSDLVGGATGFLSRDEKRRVDVNPKAGSVLIFQHDELYHEGARVTSGVKFTVRMDVLYELVDEVVKKKPVKKSK
jgi:hypothetical protein